MYSAARALSARRSPHTSTSSSSVCGEVLEAGGVDRVQGGDHAHALRHHLGRLLRRRALPDAEHARRLAGDGGGERDGGVDQQLALAQVALEVRERLGLAAERDAQEHDLARLGGGAVGEPAHVAVRDLLAHAGGGLVGAVRVARADHDRHAGRRPAAARGRSRARRSRRSRSPGRASAGQAIRCGRCDSRDGPRSSPAARRGSGRRRRGGWPRRARAWRSRTSTRRAPARWRGRSTGSPCAWTSPTPSRPARAWRPPRRRSARSTCVVNNAGHRPLRVLRQHRRGAVGLRARRQPARHDRGHARGARRDAEARLRGDRQRRLRGRPGRLAGLGRSTRPPRRA